MHFCDNVAYFQAVSDIKGYIPCLFIVRLNIYYILHCNRKRLNNWDLDIILRLQYCPEGSNFLSNLIIHFHSCFHTNYSSTLLYADWSSNTRISWSYFYPFALQYWNMAAHNLEDFLIIEITKKNFLYSLLRVEGDHIQSCVWSVNLSGQCGRLQYGNWLSWRMW